MATRKKPARVPKLRAQAKLTENVIPRLYGTKDAAGNVAATRTRIKISGLDTRIRGHVSARGKRSQSRRDSKN